MDKKEKNSNSSLNLKNNVGITQKLIITFIVLSILPLSVVAGFSYLNAEQTVKNKVGSYSGKMVEQVAMNIDSKIEEFERIHAMINTNLKLIENLENLDSVSSFDKVKNVREIDNDLVSIIASNNNIRAANIIKTNGESFGSGLYLCR